MDQIKSKPIEGYYNAIDCKYKQTSTLTYQITHYISSIRATKQ